MEKENIDTETLNKVLKYLEEQETKKQAKKEKKIKGNLISKIKERIPAANETELYKLEIKELGALNRLLKAIDYKEPYTPLQKYTKGILWLKEHKAEITLSLIIILILALIGAYL